MNHFTFSAVLVFFASLPVGLYFALQSGARHYFGLFWLTVALWTFFVGFQFPIINHISGDAWGWWLHIGCILVPIVYYHFSLIFTRNPKRFLLWFGYGLFLLFILLNSFSDWFTGENIFRMYYHYPKPGILYPSYVAYFQFYGLLSTWQIFKFRKQIVVPGQQFLYLFLFVHLLAWVGAMDNYLIMYDKLIFPLYPFGLYLVLPYVLIGSFSFLKLQSAQPYASNSITQKI